MCMKRLASVVVDMIVDWSKWISLDLRLEVICLKVKISSAECAGFSRWGHGVLIFSIPAPG